MKLLLTFLFLALTLVMPSAFAAEPTPAQIAQFDRQMTNLKLNGMLARAYSAAAGSPLPSPRTLGNYALTPSTVGDVLAKGKVTLPVSGVPLIIDVEAKIIKSNILPALGRFAGKVIPVLNIGVALYDLAKEVNVDAEVGPGGVPKFTKTIDNSQCAPFPFQAGYDPVGWCAANEWGGGVLVAEPSPPNECFAHALCSNGRVSGSMATAKLLSQQIIPWTLPQLLSDLDQKTSWAPSSSLANVVKDILASGEVLPEVTPTVSGPSSSPGPTSTTQNPDGSTSTISTTNQYVYEGNNISVTSTKTNNYTDSSNVTTTSTTTTVNDQKPPVEASITCGLPDTPACKIDETDTPKVVQSNEYDAAVEPSKQLQDTLRDKVAGADDKGFFSSWTSVFVTPPLAECVPYVLPERNGQSMGEINPCGVVNGVRTVMAYIWAIAALWLALGMIRKVV